MLFHVEPTKLTPEINFNSEQGILEFKGRSSPENSIQFYSHINEKLDQYIQSENGSAELVVNFEFDYFNSSSSKCLWDVFKKLIIIREKGKKVTVNWFYEEDDEDMKESGEDFRDLMDLEFNFIEREL